MTPGKRIGKYEIIGPIGRGGMADVFKAKDLELGRTVALKLLPPEFARDPERVARFMKEVRNSAAITHPNVVPVYDVGEGDGIYFYTMAYLPGGDLKTKIGSGMVPDTALPILRHMADALGAAHARGIVHRDVKPENIMFDDAGHAILTDLGIARAVTGGTRMTKTGMSIGTPHYMSPEQARGRSVDGRSDIYSLGIVFYEMLTGRVPYEADETLAVSYMHVNDPVPVLPDHLKKFQVLIHAMLAKEPAHRYQDCAALIRDIDRVTSGAKALGSGKVPGPSPGKSLGNNERQSLGTFKALITGAILALGVVAGIYFYMEANQPGIRQGGGGSVVTDTQETPPAPAPVPVEPQPRKLEVTSPDPAPPKVKEPQKTAEQKPEVLSPEQIKKQKIDDLFAEIQEDINAYRLTSPKGNNAFEKIGRALEFGADKQRVIEGYDLIFKRYVPLVKKAFEQEDFTKLADYFPKLRKITLEKYRHSNFTSKKDFQNNPPLSLFGDLFINFSLCKKLIRDCQVELAGQELFNSREFCLFLIDETQFGVIIPDDKTIEDVRLEIIKDFQKIEKKLSQAKANKKYYDNYLRLGKNAATVEQSIAFYEKAAAVFTPGSPCSDAAVTKLQTAKKALEQKEAEEARARRQAQIKEQAAAEARQEAEKQKAGPSPGQNWKEPVTGMQFVWVPGGCYQMGDTFGDGVSDEKPVHKVCLDGFWMGRYEVTQAEYRKITGQNPSGFKGDRRPVEKVSWHDARSFISKLNSQSSMTFDLPTEAQWEYAARSAGKKEKYAGSNTVNQVAWYRKNSGGQTHPVGTKSANGLGLHDMSGNVWEWCKDRYANNAYSKHALNNPVINSGKSLRVIRGGGWGNGPGRVRAAGRAGGGADARDAGVGFRLCVPKSGRNTEQ